MSNQKDYTVRATHCSHQASLDEIYDRLVEITAPLHRSWAKIEKARRIGIKINMQMRTIVLTPDDFERWVEEQLAGKAAAQALPTEETPEAAGATLFETHCISCHVVDGAYESAAGGNANLLAGIAPNLTNLMSRTAFAGALYETYQTGPDGAYLRNPDGSLKLNIAELREWVRNAPDMKPARADNQQGMLDFSEVLTDQDLDNLMAYLKTLGSPPVLP